jgi:hypothetical protein
MRLRGITFSMYARLNPLIWSFEMTILPNKPDAANPAMTPRLHIRGFWRRVADLER